MKYYRTVLLSALSIGRHASAFTTAPLRSTVSGIYTPVHGGCRTRRRHIATQSQGLGALPTADDVSTDDFMKQLGHASQIIPLLHPQGDDELTEDQSSSLLEVLSRQLSHSDGIRGFFAVYLTSPESLTVEEVPAVLAEAVRGADAKVMVPLACMNVIMPTAMSSIHEDDELKECASKTAANGKKILRLLKGNDDVILNCNAISRACRASESEDQISEDLIEYWEKFFVNYKYEEQQKNDIALAVSEFC